VNAGFYDRPLKSIPLLMAANGPKAHAPCRSMRGRACDRPKDLERTQIGIRGRQSPAPRARRGSFASNLQRERPRISVALNRLRRQGSNSAAAASTSQRTCLGWGISAADRMRGVCQVDRFAAAQRAAPIRAVLSLVMTMTGMASSRGCMRPLPTNACMNNGPDNLASILGAMPPPR
jgi:hypothetical protein